MRRHIILFIACLLSLDALCQSWEIQYTESKSVKLSAGYRNENGNYVFGRASKGSDNNENSAYAMFVNNDGNYIYANFPMENGQCAFMSSLCLDDGNAFVAGRKSSTISGNNYDSLWIAIVNQNLEIEEEHTYPLETPYISVDRICMTKGNYGEIIVAANARRYNPNTGANKFDSVIFKFDTHGNMIDSKYFPMDGVTQVSEPSDVTIMPGTDNIMLFGSGFNPSGSGCVSCFDGNLNVYAHHYWDDDTDVNWMHSKFWLDNEYFLMSCMLHDWNYPENREYASVIKCDTLMNFYDSFVYNRVDTSDYTAQYGSMVYVNDSTLFLPTFFETGGSQTNPNDVVVCLIDKDLNLLGTKRLNVDYSNVRVLHCQMTNDGGCLVYGSCKRKNEPLVLVWKLMREDFAIPCTVTEIHESDKCSDVFPNPTDGIINFIIDDTTNDYVTVSITDENGRKLFDKKIFLSATSVINIDVSSFDDGVYMYQIVNGKYCHSGKFIKE